MGLKYSEEGRLRTMGSSVQLAWYIITHLSQQNQFPEGIITKTEALP